MGAVKVARGDSLWSANHLLAHCEGYRVESEEGKLGYVEEVVWAPTGREPLALRVRTGFEAQGLVTLMIEDVLELHPDGERIVVGTQAGRAEPLETHGPWARPERRARITKRKLRPALKPRAR